MCVAVGDGHGDRMCRGYIASSKSESTHLLCLNPNNQRQPLCLSKRMVRLVFVCSVWRYGDPFVSGTEAYKKWLNCHVLVVS